MGDLDTWNAQRKEVYNQWVLAQKAYADSKFPHRATKKKVMNELEQELKRIDGNINEANKALAFQTLANQGQNAYSDMRSATGDMVTGIISSTGVATSQILLASAGVSSVKNQGQQIQNQATALAMGVDLPTIPTTGIFEGKNKMLLIGGAILALFLIMRK